MSLTIIMIIVGALILGVALGYYLRLIISLGKKGSMELEIKHMMVSAKEQAQRIVDEGKKKDEEKAEELHQEEKKKEIEFKKTEERLIKKEGLMDARQTEIDKKLENEKLKVKKIKKIKERAENVEKEKLAELESIARLTETEAKEEMFKIVEKKAEEDILVRMVKLENASHEKLDRRAKEILATSIQRLASSTASEFMTTIVNIP